MGSTGRLNALDAAFLDIESANVPFVVASIMRYDRHIELARLRAFVDAALDGLPRYRQRLDRVPLLHHPVWVDDLEFAVDRHVHPVPPEISAEGGGLEEVAAALLSRDLPADRPPWQFWLADAGGGKSAVIAAVHHSLVDGVAGVHLLERMLRAVPDAGQPRPASRPPPAPPPSGRRLLVEELRSRARNARQIGRGLSGPADVAREVGDLLWKGLHPASDIGLNPRRSSRSRAVASCDLELEALKQVRRRFGVTLNDVVLAVSAGALRHLLARRGVDFARARDVRAMVPVSTLARGDEAVSGNRVALLLAPLPVDEPDPVERLRRIAAATRELKEKSGQREAGEFLFRLSDSTTPALLAGTMKLSLALRGFNVVVTNIPGPPFQLYLMDARLESITPLVNVWPHSALGIAVMSYAGRLAVGLQADSAILADLKPLARDVLSSMAELEQAAGPAAPGPDRAAPAPPAPPAGPSA